MAQTKTIKARPMTPPEMITVLRAAWTPWPNATVSDEAVKVFLHVLKDFSQVEALAAAMMCLSERGRSAPPTPSEIRDAILALRKKELAAQHHAELMKEEENLPDDETIARQKREARAKYPWLYE